MHPTPITNASSQVGRYWLMKRNDPSYCPGGATTCPTQQYYHIPAAWLNPSNMSPPKENLLVMFDVTGATDITKVALATSSMAHSGSPNTAVVDPTKVVSCEF
jgi:hypothetical protein